MRNCPTSRESITQPRYFCAAPYNVWLFFLLQTEAMEDQDQSAPMSLEEANDRTLNLVLEGGEDTLRRASAANLKVVWFHVLIQGDTGGRAPWLG